MSAVLRDCGHRRPLEADDLSAIVRAASRVRRAAARHAKRHDQGAARTTPANGRRRSGGPRPKRGGASWRALLRHALRADPGTGIRNTLALGPGAPRSRHHARNSRHGSPLRFAENHPADLTRIPSARANFHPVTGVKESRSMSRGHGTSDGGGDEETAEAGDPGAGTRTLSGERRPQKNAGVEDRRLSRRWSQLEAAAIDPQDNLRQADAHGKPRRRDRRAQEAAALRYLKLTTVPSGFATIAVFLLPRTVSRYSTMPPRVTFIPLT